MLDHEPENWNSKTHNFLWTDLRFLFWWWFDRKGFWPFIWASPCSWTNLQRDHIEKLYTHRLENKRKTYLCSRSQWGPHTATNREIIVILRGGDYNETERTLLSLFPLVLTNWNNGFCIFSEQICLWDFSVLCKKYKSRCTRLSFQQIKINIEKWSIQYLLSV